MSWLLVTSLAASAAATANGPRDYRGLTYETYLAEHRKAYAAPAELERRRALFETNRLHAVRQNAAFLAGTQTWWMTLNEMADWTVDEFRARRLGRNASIPSRMSSQAPTSSVAIANPKAVDWREKKVVTEPRDQGGCGSCWAFAATETIESHAAIATGSLSELAVQAIVSCASNPKHCGGSGGCDGATAQIGFDMVKEKGIPLERDFSYAAKTSRCHRYRPAVSVGGYVQLPTNDANALETALANVGPVAVSAAASCWMLYGGGVYDGCSQGHCPVKSMATEIDHGIQAVGYGVDGDKGYWLIRNSWGTGWGEDGYIRLSRTADSKTFIDDRPKQGSACEPYPKQAIIGGECGILFDSSYPTNVSATTEVDMGTSTTQGAEAEALVELHEPAFVPSDWQLLQTEPVNLDASVEVFVAMRRPFATKLHSTGAAVSDPSSASYAEHLSSNAVDAFVRSDGIGKIRRWLEAKGAIVQMHKHGDSLVASMTRRQLEALLGGRGARFATYERTSDRLRLVRMVGAVHVPKHIADSIDVISGFGGFPIAERKPRRTGASASNNKGHVTPPLLAAQYSVDASGIPAGGPRVVQAVAQFQGNVYIDNDLKDFCHMWGLGHCNITKLIGTNDGGAGVFESDLDVEYISSSARGGQLETWVFGYDGKDFCSQFLTFLADASANAPDDAPMVISISYGTQHRSLFGHGTPCNAATIKRSQDDMAKLASMGVTVVFASGDDGSGQYSRQGDNHGWLNPGWPASVNFALAVGSTYFMHGLSGEEEATKRFGSGGGFSVDYPVPSYQQSAIDAYLNSTTLPTGVKFGVAGHGVRATGRGTPDVSALGDNYAVIYGGINFTVGGTSASAPLWGSLLALLAKARAKSGKKLGFINPLLYAHPEAFTDIVHGTNAVKDGSGHGGDVGWEAQKGWDACTGLGTPRFDKLLSLIEGLNARDAERATARAAGTAPHLEREWDAFKGRFGKRYASEEEEARHRDAFGRELRRVTSSAEGTQGINKFSDSLSDEEFSRRWLGRVDKASTGTPTRRWDGTCYACGRYPHFAVTPPADRFDWTEHGAVTPVKKQNCGDCYAFGTTGDIEGVWFLAGHPLVSLSEEAIVDCCFEDEGILQCAGCAGGNQENVFDWIVSKGGINSEKTYPYTVAPKHGHPSNCRRDLLTNSSFSATISGWYQVSKGASEEDHILEQLQKVGPITVGLDATTAKLKAYTGGVHAPAACKDWVRLDHAVLIVGYGVDGGVPYWRVKNSWGDDWGEGGYFRIKRGVNMCGIAMDAVHSKP